MDMNKALSKIATNYATGHRGDLAITDFHKITANTAQCLIEFEPKFGKPTGSDIEGYFSKMFGGSVKPVMASCLIKPKAVSVVAKVDVETLAFEDVKANKRFTPIVANLVYLDNELKDTWEVREEEGKKVLAKQGYEDIAKIIAERKNGMFMEASPKVSFSAVHAAHGQLQPKDIVKVFVNDKLKEIEITAFTEEGIAGKDAEGNEITVVKEAVMDLVQASTEVRAASEAAYLEKYYAEAYGDKAYAKALVKSY